MRYPPETGGRNATSSPSFTTVIIRPATVWRTRETVTFNLLPLRYGWAYELYRAMKANHWEPEDIPMGKDIEQWRDEKIVSDVERWIIRMGIGYFSAAGEMDSCIVLRTALIKDGTMYVQAGGGVVADSQQEAEYQETINKARALLAAAEEAVRFASAAKKGQ